MGRDRFFRRAVSYDLIVPLTQVSGGGWPDRHPTFDVPLQELPVYIGRRGTGQLPDGPRAALPPLMTPTFPLGCFGSPPEVRRNAKALLQVREFQHDELRRKAEPLRDQICPFEGTASF